MSRHEPELTLRQIIEFADEVAALAAKRRREDLETNREFRRALERCVELMGEAAKRLPRRLAPSALRNPVATGYRDAQCHDPRLRCGC